MYTLFFLLITFLAILFHLLFTKQPKTKKIVLETILMYFLVFCVGVGGIFAFIGHAFYGVQIAKQIGWLSGNPFQFEVAIANLAFGVLGLLSIKLKRGFWLATGLGSVIFYYGAAFGHIKDIIIHHNYAPYNSGTFLYMGDIFIPSIILILLILYVVTFKKRT
jgi:hypothetical protein